MSGIVMSGVPESGIGTQVVPWQDPVKAPVRHDEPAGTGPQ